MSMPVNTIGFRSGLIAFLSTVAFTLVQTLQLLHILSYPWDEILIYGTSLCIVVPFIFEMLALHYAAPVEKRIWSHAGLLFTVIYAVFVIANYVVQLATVIPLTLEGQADDIRVLMQTPHSLFWDFDAIGYICMGLATLFTVPVFRKKGWERWVRYSFLVHGLVTTPLIAFVYFYPGFSETVLLLGIPWVITAPLSMLLLALFFRKRGERANSDC
jgi:hypothetical protein